MPVQVDFSSLKQNRWYQIVIRFVAGGLATVMAGLIAKKYGAGIGGLFLAFPAILPASATLIEKHEKERKQRVGMHGAVRARQAVAADAAGAALGSIGLLAFALLLSLLLVKYNPWLMIASATTLWLVVSLIAWQIRQRM
jgi:uncharacterized protein DUF3147